MRWYEAELLTENNTTDALNEVLGDGSFTLAGRTIARISPWTIEEIAALGREVTETQLRLEIPVHAAEDLDKATHIRLLEYGRYTGAMKIVYPIRDLSPRWLSVTVKAVRT